MSLYEILLFFHILAAIVWIGGALVLNVVTARMARGELGVVVPHFAWYASRVIAASSLVLIVAAFGLVADGDWSLGEPWLIIALVIFLASGFIGGGLLGKTANQIVA